MDAVGTTRRMIQRYGELITIRRSRPGVAMKACSPVAFVQGFNPEALVGAIVSGQRTVRITDDEVAAAGMSPPQQSDTVLIDGKVARIVSVDTVRCNGLVAQHVLVVSGE